MNKFTNQIQLIRDSIINENKIIDDIKQYLITENGYDSWEEFVDRQEIGDCQNIAFSVYLDFKKYGIRSIFGEIKVDTPYIDEYNKKQKWMTHHWNILNNHILDFAKGTLKEYIEFDDIYDVTVDKYESKRYRIIHEQ